MSTFTKKIKFCESREKQKYNKTGILVFVLTVTFFLRHKVIMFLNDGLAKKELFNDGEHFAWKKYETSKGKRKD